MTALIALARAMADLVELALSELDDEQLEELRAALQRGHDAVAGEVVRRSARERG